MVNSVLTIKCGECLGHGLIFFGDNEDYHVEGCECVANEQLF